MARTIPPRPKSPDIPCLWCKQYQNGEGRDEKGNRLSIRLCPTAKRKVDDCSIACPQVELKHTFYCDSRRCWMFIGGCSRSFETEVYEDCGDCHIGEMANIYYRWAEAQRRKAS